MGCRPVYPHLQASPAWDAAARLRGAVRTPYGDLRLFARKKAEKAADLGGVAGMSEHLNEQGGLGKPNPPTNTPESQKTASEYATAKSTQSTSPGSRGYEPSAKGFTQEERRSSATDLLARMDPAGPSKGQKGAPPPPPPPSQPTGQRPGQHFNMGKNLLDDLAMPGQGKKQKQQPPQAAMNKAPPMPAPPLGEFAPHLPAPPLGEFKIPKVRKEKSNSLPKTAGYTPKPPNKQLKGKKDKAKAKSTKSDGETYGERALRLQKEAWEKQQKAAAASDTESTSSRSSARTTRSTSSKREHSPGGPSMVKKKDDKPSPAAAKQ